MQRLAILLFSVAVVTQIGSSANAEWRPDSHSITLTAAVGDAQITHTFPFTTPGNDGDTPITITDIKTSCGCTTAIVKG